MRWNMFQDGSRIGLILSTYRVDFFHIVGSEFYFTFFLFTFFFNFFVLDFQINSRFKVIRKRKRTQAS